MDKIKVGDLVALYDEDDWITPLAGLNMLVLKIEEERAWLWADASKQPNPYNEDILWDEPFSISDLKLVLQV